MLHYELVDLLFFNSQRNLEMRHRCIPGLNSLGARINKDSVPGVPGLFPIFLPFLTHYLPASVGSVILNPPVPCQHREPPVIGFISFI